MGWALAFGMGGLWLALPFYPLGVVFWNPRYHEILNLKHSKSKCLDHSIHYNFLGNLLLQKMEWTKKSKIRPQELCIHVLNILYCECCLPFLIFILILLVLKVSKSFLFQRDERNQNIWKKDEICCIQNKLPWFCMHDLGILYMNSIWYPSTRSLCLRDLPNQIQEWIWTKTNLGS